MVQTRPGVVALASHQPLVQHQQQHYSRPTAFIHLLRHACLSSVTTSERVTRRECVCAHSHPGTASTSLVHAWPGIGIRFCNCIHSDAIDATHCTRNQRQVAGIQGAQRHLALDRRLGRRRKRRSWKGRKKRGEQGQARWMKEAASVFSLWPSHQSVHSPAGQGSNLRNAPAAKLHSPHGTRLRILRPLLRSAIVCSSVPDCFASSACNITLSRRRRLDLIFRATRFSIERGRADFVTSKSTFLGEWVKCLRANGRRTMLREYLCSLQIAPDCADRDNNDTCEFRLLTCPQSRIETPPTLTIIARVSTILLRVYLFCDFLPCAVFALSRSNLTGRVVCLPVADGHYTTPLLVLIQSALYCHATLSHRGAR